MFFLIFLLADRRIRIQIHTSDYLDPDPGAQKHTDPDSDPDSDLQHCHWCNSSLGAFLTARIDHCSSSY